VRGARRQSPSDRERPVPFEDFRLTRDFATDGRCGGRVGARRMEPVADVPAMIAPTVAELTPVVER